MKMVKGLITLTLSVIIAVSAQAEACLKPSKVLSGRAALRYAARAGSTICLETGPKVQILAVTKKKVKIRVGNQRAEYTLNDTIKGFSTSDMRLSLKKISQRDNDLSITVEIMPSFEPMMCAQYSEPVMCMAVYEPVCGMDPLGNVKVYGNSCEASVDCARIIEPTFCNLAH